MLAKLLTALRFMKSNTKATLAIVLLLSLVLNAYFFHKAFMTPPRIVVNTRVVEKPIKVVEVKTDYVIETKYVERPTVNVPEGSSEEAVLLARIESATPVIKTEMILVVQNNKEQWVFPDKIKGELKLDYLKYDFSMKLDPKMVYSREFDIPVDFAIYNYYKNDQLKDSVGVMLPITIPFTDQILDVGLGLNMFTVGSRVRVRRNLSVVYGLGYTYDKEFAPYVGVSFKI